MKQIDTSANTNELIDPVRQIYEFSLEIARIQIELQRFSRRGEIEKQIRLEEIKGSAERCLKSLIRKELRRCQLN